MKYPKGYLQEESRFCTEELRIFYQEDTPEWREAHRELVLKKRDEFKKRWNRTHVEQVK